MPIIKSGAILHMHMDDDEKIPTPGFGVEAVTDMD